MSAPPAHRLGPAGRLGGFFIDNQLTPLLVVAALAVGAFALLLTPREEEPQIVVPMVDVFASSPGSEVAEVESRLTLPLERRLSEIPGVEYVYSTSMPGRALVTARFRVGDEPERSLVKVYDQLASDLDRLPPGAAPPLVRSRSIDDVPVLALTLSSRQHDGFALRRLAAELAAELSALEDVSELRIIGGERRQLRVVLDAGRLAAAGLDAVSVIDALAQANAAAATGRYTAADGEVLVEIGGFLRSAAEVASLVVGVDQGRPRYLRDVADILDAGEEPRQHVFHLDGAGAGDRDAAPAAAVTLSLAKRKGADAYRVVQRARAAVEAARGGLLPPAVTVSVSRDYGATAKDKADELLRHLALAIVSVSVVIGLALGWRGALVVFVSVPVSFALTLFVYYVFGYTLNRVTLFALIFVTGIVVDDSIIVVENIVRHFAAGGRSAREAAVAAIDEVGNPTILATLTVIAAVLPMAFVRGLMGPYMLPMPVGATLAMSFSLLVALVAAPWFAFRLLRHTGPHENSIADDAAPRGLAYRGYRRLLRPLMLRPHRAWIFLAVVGLLLLASMALVPLGWVSLKMLPFDNKSELMAVLDLPEGTSLERTARITRAMAERLAEDPAVRDLQLYVGTAAPITFTGLVRHYDLRAGANLADIQVNLRAKHERSEQSHAIARRLRTALAPLAERFGVALKIVEVPPGPPVLQTLVAEVYAPNEAERLALGEAVREIFDETPGVVDVDWLVEAPQRKEVFRVDHPRAALAGVPVTRLARLLAVATAGADVGLLHDADAREPVPIHLELPRAERSSRRSLAALRIAAPGSAPGSAPVPLSELVHVEQAVREPSRHRKNLLPVVYVLGDVAGSAESPAYAILAMHDAIAAIATPGGGSVAQHFRGAPTGDHRPAVVWDGEWQITYEVFRDLGAAFGVALLLIYLLIVGWFRSFGVPLVMMIAIPLALIGVLPGHALAGAYFTATSMIGFIALAGIMVRNSVLLIDFVDLQLERGRSLGEAVLEAGATRLRPILLTAGTVVVGAVVILFDPIFQGLAISLISGAVASTALTLVVVPLVHFLTVRGQHRQPLPAAWMAAE